MSATTSMPASFIWLTKTSWPPLPNSLLTQATAIFETPSVFLKYGVSDGTPLAAPEEVRKMYGLPCMVMLGASDPVICGMPFCFATIMLTMVEPE